MLHQDWRPGMRMSNSLGALATYTESGQAFGFCSIITRASAYSLKPIKQPVRSYEILLKC